MQPEPSDRLLSAHRDHDRHFQENRFVYPVLSRRSRGISVGINLNPDKICNFDCVYCQVDRSIAPEFRQVEPARVVSELEETIALVQAGRLYDDPRFVEVPGSLRRLSDIAFSGDGEPTTYPGFLEIVRDVAALKRRLNLGDVTLVLFTNATMLHRKEVKEALRGPRRQPGGNLGETRCRLRGRLPGDRPDRDSTGSYSGKHRRRGP